MRLLYIYIYIYTHTYIYAYIHYTHTHICHSTNSKRRAAGVKNEISENVGS